MTTKSGMNVTNFPCQTRLERVARHIRVCFNGLEVADTCDAYMVLQAYRPPEYYLPRSAIKVPLSPTGYRPACEWKGQTTHYAMTGGNGIVLANRAWSYESPKPPYEAIRGCVSFYARPWQCFVDGKRVVPQRSDLRGGWVTSDITGVVGEDDPVF